MCVPVFLLITSVAHAALPVTVDQIKQVIPGAASHARRVTPLDHYVIQDAQGRVIGIAFVTSEIPPEVSSYHGEMDVLVGMDTAGRITGAQIIGHRDDPPYINKIVSSGFLKRFIGRSIEDGFDDIETVTGATISSSAAKRDIQTAAFEVHAKLIDAGIAGGKKAVRRDPFEAAAVAVTMLLIAAAVTAVRMTRRRWLRYGLWIADVAVIGVWLNAPLTIGPFINLRAGLLPGYLPLVMLMIFAVGAALMRGNLYCAYLCPFGALQEAAARVKLPKCRPVSVVERDASWLRWIVLIITVFAVATGVAAFRMIEPFSRLFARSIVPPVWMQAAVILGVALFIRRPWCTYFCPTGAVLDLLSRFGCKIRRPLRRFRKECDNERASA